jgi:hypothetical protein
LVYVSKLFKASGIDGFTKAALFYPPLGGNDVTGKIVFFKELKKVLGSGISILALSVGKCNWLKDGIFAFFSRFRV